MSDLSTYRATSSIPAQQECCVPPNHRRCVAPSPSLELGHLATGEGEMFPTLQQPGH